MKTRNFAFTALFLLNTAAALACGSKPAADPAPIKDPDLSPLKLNVDSIKDLLLKNNYDIALGANDLMRSRLNQSLAKAGLFPSVNIPGVAASIANPSYLIREVDILLPFLVPSNWFKLASAKRQYQADQKVFEALRKDTLATTLSLYISILRENDLLQLLRRDLEDLRLLENATIDRHRAGLASDGDLNTARSTRLIAESQVLRTEQYLDNFELQLKRTLAVDPRRPLELEYYSVPEIPEESWPYEKIRDQAWEKSLGREEMEKLVLVNANNAWANALSFFGSASLSSVVSGNNKHPDFSGDSTWASGAFTLSYSIVPQVKLSLNNKKKMQIFLQSMKNDADINVQQFVNDFHSDLKRMDIANQAVDTVQTNFELQLARYTKGSADFQTVLNARLGMDPALNERLDADRELNVTRITLQRMLDTGIFQNLDLDPTKLP